jgi:hypothetical protein
VETSSEAKPSDNRTAEPSPQDPGWLRLQNSVCLTSFDNPVPSPSPLVVRLLRTLVYTTKSPHFYPFRVVCATRLAFRL